MSVVNFYNYIFLALILLFFVLNFKKFNNTINIIQKIIIFLFHTLAFITMQSTISYFYFTSLILINLGNIIINFLYKNSSKLLWNNIFFMIMLGCVILFSLNTSLAHKQLNWYIIGFIVCCGVPITIKYLPRLNLKIVKYLYLLITLTLFLATLIIGEEDFGAKNWLTVFGLTFQPSEFNKLFFILYLTSSLTEYNLKFLNFKELVKKLSLPTIISIIFILCLVLQNDLGSALIFFVTYLCIVYVSSSRAWILGLSGILFGIACRFAYNNFSHVKIRIDIWADPYNHIYTTGEQILKSLISISSAGFMGIGLNTERLSEIPVVEKDLIFSAICEELGILFGIMLVLLILNTFNICLKISTSTNSRFLSLLSFGIINLLIFQSFLTIGGSINLIPLTGVTLPFISYGGSSTIVSFISIGLIQWIFTRNFNIKNNKIIKY